MEDKAYMTNNNIISTNINQNNINFNRPMFSALNDNQFNNRHPFNYNNYDNNNYNNNIFINNNNEIGNNKYINNNYIPPYDYFFQKNGQNEEKENQTKNIDFSNKTNYIPMNQIKNESRYYPNKSKQIYEQDSKQNFHNDNSYDNQSYIYNYNQDNENDNNFRSIITEIKNDENKIINKKKPNKVYKVYSYLFDSNMEDVIDIMTNQNYFKDDCNIGRIDNVKFPEENFAKSGNNIVSLRWKKFYEIKLLSSNQQWTKSSISYTLSMVELIPENIGSLEINFKYYYNTCQNNTLFIIEYIIDKGILSEVFKEEFLDEDMNDICFYFENIIKQRKKARTHVSSLIINISKENAFNNFKILNKRRYTNFMNKYNLFYIKKNEEIINNKNNITEEDNSNLDYYIQKGDSIIIKKNDNEIFCCLVIDDIKEEKDKNEIIMTYNKLENQSKEENRDKNNDKDIEVLNQKIIFSIKEIMKDICYLEFTHIWQDWVDINKIKSLDILKINSLKKIKKILTIIDEEGKEKKNNDNYMPLIFNLICPTEL